MKKEILVVVNPCAGKGKVNKYIPKICDNLKKQGYELEVIYTSEKNNGEEIIENYLRFIDAVVVCGGDGTLSEVINGIMKCRKSIDVAFIPFGTTNDFAKTLKISKKHYKLSKKLSKYKELRIDVGRFNYKFFYYISAFGLCTNISYTTNQKEKNKYGRFAYYRKALKSLKNLKTYKTTIVTDNEIIRDEFIYGGISNSISIAGFKWFKRNDYSINDGIFEIILVKKPKSKFELLKIFISILRKKYDQKNIYYLKSSHLKFDFEEEVEWTLDGEYGGKYREIIIENKKHKLDLLVSKNNLK